MTKVKMSLQRLIKAAKTAKILAEPGSMLKFWKEMVKKISCKEMISMREAQISKAMLLQHKALERMRLTMVRLLWRDTMAQVRRVKVITSMVKELTSRVDMG